MPLLPIHTGFPGFALTAGRPLAQTSILLPSGSVPDLGVGEKGSLDTQLGLDRSDDSSSRVDPLSLSRLEL